jgi:hypothetical protein
MREPQSSERLTFSAMFRNSKGCWEFYPAVDDVSNGLGFGKLPDGLWPVALGAGLAPCAATDRLVSAYVPAGDSIVLEQGAFHRLLKTGPTLEMFDARLRQRPAAGDLVAFDYPGSADGGPLRKLVDAQVP